MTITAIETISSVINIFNGIKSNLRSKDAVELSDKLIDTQQTIFSMHRQMEELVQKAEKLQKLVDIRTHYELVQRDGFTALKRIQNKHDPAPDSLVGLDYYVCQLCAEKEGLTIVMQPAVLDAGTPQDRYVLACPNCRKTEFPM